MLYIQNQSTNPYFNLALEEYFLEDKKDDYFILWQNEPTIVVGKYQNTIEEINKDFVDEKNINIVRRLSGGGAVYHDDGNLNFTFIANSKDTKEIDFKFYTKPIIDALKNMGVEACLKGRNDLVIGEKKISGNAQCIKKGRVLHHGTLLFNSEMENLIKALNVSDVKIISKGIKSIRSRVTNIKDYLDEDLNIEDLMKYILKELDIYNIKEYILTIDDKTKINKLMKEKYILWDWNYGKSPEFNITKELKFKGGNIKAYIYVDNGYIKSFKFHGDFFANKELKYIENLIIGTKYKEDEIKNKLKDTQINNYIVGLDNDLFLKIIL